MEILTKKQIEAVEPFKINDQGGLVTYEDFLALKETLEKIVEAADVCLTTGFGDMLEDVLDQYEQED
jgi:hypothetical protein